MFQADGYDASTQTYRGVFVDVATLARDLELERAGVTLQGLFLATLLATESAETRVTLSTDACTKNAMQGTRTFKRVSFADVAALRRAVLELTARAPRPVIWDALPRSEVIAFLRERVDTAITQEERNVFASLEGAVFLRELPDRGPLSEPDLWALETRLDRGEVEGILDAIDRAEQNHGRSPGTSYLRARASLVLHLEPAQTIAVHVSALAGSMTSFHELAILAAEAWLQAEEPRRALALASDLVKAPELDEGLLLRAERLVARAVGAAPASAPEREAVATARPEAALTPAPRGSVGVQEEVVRIPASVKPASTPSARPQHVTLQAVEPAPFDAPHEVSPPAPATSFTVELPSPDPGPPPVSVPPSRPRSSRRPALMGVRMETRPPSSFDPRAEPDTSPFQQTPRAPEPFPPPRGASLPPYERSRTLPTMPSMDRIAAPSGAPGQLAEHLPPPRGAAGEPGAASSTPSIIDVRVQFTQLSRELGRDYRLKHGIELRADVHGIEAFQSILLRTVTDDVDAATLAVEIRKHGAFLSEILARNLGAQWVDISPEELGYWAMIVPPDTRVWPFGRVARFVSMGAKERDLVSYYRELESRAHTT
jgi:hypothetical protein